MQFLSQQEMLRRRYNRRMLFESMGETAVQELDQAMLVAAEKGHRIELNSLLEQGADPNATDQNGFTALILATQPGCILTLLECYADPFKSNGDTPLVHHILNGDLIVARIISNYLIKNIPGVLGSFKDAALEAGGLAEKAGLRDTAQWVHHIFDSPTIA